MDILDEFKSDLNEGDIHFRDNYQFELKSEFFIDPNVKTNVYRQDIYLFIPATLQINSETYSKSQFYQDQTTLIRFKTPKISLGNLINESNKISPIFILKKILDVSDNDSFLILDELQLFANIFRSSLRGSISDILKEVENRKSISNEEVNFKIKELTLDLNNVLKTFWELQLEYTKKYPHDEYLSEKFEHIDEFLCNNVEYYLTCLIKSLFDYSFTPDESLYQIIENVQNHRTKTNFASNLSNGNPNAAESFLYRNSLLNQYVLEALHLNTSRLSVAEKHAPILGALAAGIAMLIYMILFAYNSSVLVINSMPFIILAVLLYVLKDRVKEGLKNYYSRKAFKWFPDYSTEIKDRKKNIFGRLNENFSFRTPNQIQPEFLHIRNHEFNEDLSDLIRQDNIIHFKREVILYPKNISSEKRRRELTMIFRFNVHHFLEKASNPLQLNLSIKNREVVERLLPKVYHINIIIRNTYLRGEEEFKVEIKKFRVVVDKFGIKRVEQIKS